MNTWLKVALYTFVAIIVGTLMLGILMPSNQMTTDMGGGLNWNMAGSNYSQNPVITNNQGVGVQSGMGMHRGMGMQQGMGMGMRGRR